MRDDRPSLTAASVGFLRAVHQVIDHPPVFADPYAGTLLGPEGRARLAADPSAGQRNVLRARLRAFVAVRSRIAEEQLAACHAAGARQYVVLGAGLDTFALRNPHEDLHVFEVDHPRTQGWKRSLLAEHGLAPRARAAFVPVDFERDRLPDALAAAGFDPGAATAIAWLGVLPYLERPAIAATFAWAAGVVHEAGALTFDYGERPAWWDVVHQLAARALAARVAAKGEPIRTSPRRDEVRGWLGAAGFRAIADLDGRSIQRRWFAGRSDGLSASGLGHVVLAARNPAVLLAATTVSS